MEPTQFRLIVSDLDGTLVLSGSNDVSPDVLETIQRLGEQGIDFIIATGRSWQETQPIAAALRAKLPVIVESGALVINPHTGSVLNMQTLAPETAACLDAVALPPGIDRFRLTGQGVFYYEETQSLCGHWLLENRECRISVPAGRKQAWLKYLFTGKPETLKSLAQQLQAGYGSLLNLILWPPEPNGECFLEVFDGAASKGRAVRRLARKLQVPLAEVIAFGDSYNDFDLLETAGCGIAMEGAPQLLLEAADLVIPGPAEEGFVRFFNGEFELTQKKAI